MKVQQLVQIAVGLILTSGMEARFLPPTPEDNSMHIMARSEGALSTGEHAELNQYHVPRAKIAKKLGKRAGHLETQRDIQRRMERFRERLQIRPEVLWGPYQNAEAHSYGQWMQNLFSSWAIEEIQKRSNKSERSIRQSFNYYERIRTRHIAEARNNPPPSVAQPDPVPQDTDKLTMSSEEYEEFLRRQTQLPGPRVMPNHELNLEDEEDEERSTISRKKVKLPKNENS